MQTSKGSYIRTVEKLPKDAVIAVFHTVGFDRSTITFVSEADKASIKSSTGDGYLLTPSTAYKVYGMADGGDTVRDYNLTISTDAAYTTLKAANSVMDSSMWGVNASQSITLSVAESPYIVPGAFVNIDSASRGGPFTIAMSNSISSDIILTHTYATGNLTYASNYSADKVNYIVPNYYTSAVFASDPTSGGYILLKNVSGRLAFSYQFTNTDFSVIYFYTKFHVVKEQ